MTGIRACALADLVDGAALRVVVDGRPTRILRRDPGGLHVLEDALRAELTELCADEPARCPGRQDEVEGSEDVVPAGPAPE